MKKVNNTVWYNNSSIITDLIIGLIILIIILSQSFAINNNLSAINIFRNIINHNMNYFLLLIYFIGIKTHIGKKYFNHLNIFLVFLYLVFTVTSFLSVFQLVSIPNLLNVFIKVVLLIYLINTMFRDTRYFSELKLNKSPFYEISSDSYNSCLIVLSCILLAFNLILVNSFDGAIITLLDTFYIILISRYVFLYSEYLDFKTMVKLKKSSSDEKEVK